MKFVSAILLLMSCLAVGTDAGDTKGVIGGHVTDPQGSVVTHAEVEITNIVDGHKQTTATDDQGHFEFRYVDVGEYRVLVSVLGFTEVAARVTVTSSLSTPPDHCPHLLISCETEPSG